MHKPIYQFSILVLIVALFYGCSSSTEEANNNGEAISNYKAEIADSVVVQRLSVVSMQAYNANNETLLLMDEQQGDMLVVDREGEVKVSFNPFVEGPNYIGNGSSGWSFYGQDEIVGYGWTHTYRYSPAGKRVQRIAHPVETGGQLTLNYNPRRILTYSSGDKLGVVSLMPIAFGQVSRNQEYHDSAQIVFKLDFGSQSTQPIFGKPEESIYRTGGEYLGNGFPTIDHLDGSEFVIGYEADKNIYIMDAERDSIMATLTLPEAYWPIIEPVPFDAKEAPNKLKVISNVYSLGDRFIVKYQGLIPEPEFKALRKLPRWYESPELKQLEKKYIKSEFLLFDREGFKGPISWDLGTTDYRYFGDKNGYIWVRREYQDERDYYTFLKIRIVEDN
ncbi:hypothetical protein [Roseivirga misakiensis]|uniref:DUF4221 domain-containing protein n=1 Tax=Roseivirga misakiensis TaxID=1563681 RepID=A0A1E5T6D7_9BACT|nr:hypothetical protein [Roseivirga misakiensis]OEK06908.1 hypothetical protein BFP71_04435 [Roseivirga misakiensis]